MNTQEPPVSVSLPVTTDQDVVEWFAAVFRRVYKRPDAAQEMEGLSEEEWRDAETLEHSRRRVGRVLALDGGPGQCRTLLPLLFKWELSPQGPDYWCEVHACVCHQEPVSPFNSMHGLRRSALGQFAPTSWMIRWARSVPPLMDIRELFSQTTTN
jgi:hypothetical protein